MTDLVTQFAKEWNTSTRRSKSVKEGVLLKEFKSRTHFHGDQ